MNSESRSLHDDSGPEARGEYWALPKSSFQPALFIVVTVVLLSIFSGRVFRATFDDEIYTLELIREESPLSIWGRVLGLDKHPPFAYALFGLLAHLGLPIPAMRCISLILGACAVAIWYRLFLRSHPRLSEVQRFVVTALFAAPILTIAKADALRWYGVFSFATALGIWLARTRAHSRGTKALLCAVMCVLSATNFLGFAVSLGIALLVGGHRPREWWEHRGFWLSAAASQLPGLLYLGSLRHSSIGAEAHVLFSFQDTFLLLTGLLGGHSLGVSLAWTLVLPAVFYAWYLLAGARDFFWQCNLAVVAVIALIGNGNAYSYLWAEPIWISGFASLYLSFSARRARTALLVGVALCTSASLLNGLHTSRPFRRSDGVPYEDIVHGIVRSASANDLVIVTDPNVAYSLREVLPQAFFFNVPVTAPLLSPPHGVTSKLDPCRNARLTPGERARVLILDGRPEYEAMWGDWEQYKRTTLGIEKPSFSISFRRDDDAWIKRWLSGVPLDDYLLHLAVFEVDCISRQ